MSDRNFILAPKVVSVDFQIHPTFATLNTLGMLCEVEEYPGVDEFMVQLAKNLPAEVMRTNINLMEVGYNLLFNFRPEISTLPEYIDALAAASPSHLQSLAVECFLNKHTPYKNPNITIPTPEDFLGNAEVALNYIQTLHEDKGAHFDPEPFKQGYRLLQTPYVMQQNLVNHLSYMWENHMAANWQRVAPIVEETVQAFRQQDYKGMSGIEVGRAVTGRDMSGTWVGDLMEKTEKMVFVPSPYIGPYVGGFYHSDNTVYIFFRPHLPEGTSHKASPALHRSELLVRLNALADDSRLRILELFKDEDELCAQDIIQLLDLSQSAASRHLRQLTATGYLTERRKEGAKCYRLNDERVLNTLQAVQTFLAIH